MIDKVLQTVPAVPSNGNCRAKQWKLPCQAMETVVPSNGNCRAKQWKLSCQAIATDTVKQSYRLCIKAFGV
ncbi:hypothetical protein [Bacteroides xylanisolvens]|uniref:hypothetical protein n=1 Tax=Bacteroides xylanisolvens TaxID=371601 RepID=UPI0018993FFE|nr:hypothetical protein [Bacteroides xylanisolvens]